MRFLCVILLFLSAVGNAQDIIIVPQVSFGFGINYDEFLSKNNGVELKGNIIIPELYLGSSVVFDKWTIGLHYGIFQTSIFMNTGYNIRLGVKSEKKKKYY